MYLTYFKREFAKKHGNCGVLARFVLFLSGIQPCTIQNTRLRYPVYCIRNTLLHKIFGYNFFCLPRLLTVLQRGGERQITGAVSLLSYLLKKTLCGLSWHAPVFEHRKSRAIKRPADSSFCRSNRILCRNIR